MAFRDLLLHISTYPEPTPPSAIDHAVRFSAGLGGTLSALAQTVAIPVSSNRVADALVGLSALAREEEAKSQNARGVDLSYFAARATAAGVLGDLLSVESHLYDVAENLTAAARTRDLCMLALGSPLLGQEEMAESVIFGSGHPVLLFRPERIEPSASAPERVVVAWDGSRCAARAMADAMPILKRATEVQLLIVGPDANKTMKAPAFEALRHLKIHHVNANIHEAEAPGHAVGPVLEAELRARPADLLVMGAYGHSRLRELILGGVTEHMIRTASTPIFLSH